MFSDEAGWAKRIGHWLGAFATVALIAACGSSVSTTGTGPGSGSGEDTPVPTAQIGSISPAMPSVGQVVSFAGSGSGQNIQYAWDFGDGATAQGAEATHTYAVSGTFAITFSVTDGSGQKARATSQVIIEAVATAPSAPQIMVAPGQALVGVAKGMQATSVDPNGEMLTYGWNFGDAATATGQNVTHTYASVGTFTVTVIATNQTGASATATAQLTVTSAPVPEGPPSPPTILAPPAVRLNTPAKFVGISESLDGSALDYVWHFSGDTFTATGPVVQHNFLNVSQQATATLTVTDSRGNSASAAATVMVLPLEPPHSVVVRGPLEAVVGEAVGFSASVENPEGNPLAYQWDFGDGTTSTEVAPSHTYSAQGQHTVSVTIDDQLTGSATGSMTLFVAGTGPVDELECAGQARGAGWCIAPTLPIGNTALNAVSFANARSGWIVGENGGVVHSTDGGITWTSQLTTPSGQIGVSAADNDHAWVLNRNRQVLRTTDGGTTWNAIPTGAPFGLTAIRFVDPAHGWAVGQSEGIVATTDGGTTWVVQNSNTSKPALNRLDFVDVNNGWAVSAGGYVMQTGDSGQSWNTVFQAASGIALADVSFSDTLHGWVVGTSGTLMQTTDGGTTWVAGSAPTSESIVAVKFVSPSVGWIVTETGFIFRTEDAGISWTAQNTPTQTTGLPAIDAANANNAWIVSAGGSYLITVTGGN
ncbi:PKD domain-containing protein [Paraburkholderia metrosideri]|uniref:PKD domain-containing protein n=1 Tax=Paraburkholderia metrosideri TaxID=580937 RepID=A0ABW9E8J9_9BURK